MRKFRGQTTARCWYTRRRRHRKWPWHLRWHEEPNQVYRTRLRSHKGPSRWSTRNAQSTALVEAQCTGRYNDITREYFGTVRLTLREETSTMETVELINLSLFGSESAEVSSWQPIMVSEAAKIHVKRTRWRRSSMKTENLQYLPTA